MGRGAQAQTQAMIDQQLAQQNAMNQQLYSTSQGLGSQAASGYQNLIANPGYTDAEKSAITNLSQSALSSSFDALAQNASTRAARSDTLSGLSGLSGLYGTDSSLLGRTLGIPAQLLGTQMQNARNNTGFLNSLGSTLGRTLGGLPSFLGL